MVGLAGFGESDSLFGATWAMFVPGRVGQAGKLDTISVVAEPGVSGVALQRSISEVLPRVWRP